MSSIFHIAIFAAVVLLFIASNRPASCDPRRSRTRAQVLHARMVHHHWLNFRTQHQKRYDSIQELGYRRSIFAENLLTMLAHNLLFKQGKTSYEMSVNSMYDMQVSEVTVKRSGMMQTAIGNATTLLGDAPPPLVGDVPESVDWVKAGAVTAVRNQGDCGGCWAFSAVGAIEGLHFKQSKTLVRLSEQNLIDCARGRNMGCTGGLMDEAFTYVHTNGGIDLDATYEYTAKQGECRYNATQSSATVENFVRLPKGDEDKLKQAVALAGPISVAVDATLKSFQLYGQGVYYDKDCSNTTVSHGVLLVGYGIDAKTKDAYWLVKNSWGPDWGEKGYIRIARNRENQCCITCQSSYPL